MTHTPTEQRHDESVEADAFLFGCFGQAAVQGLGQPHPKLAAVAFAHGLGNRQTLLQHRLNGQLERFTRRRERRFRRRAVALGVGGAEVGVGAYQPPPSCSIRRSSSG